MRHIEVKFTLEPNDERQREILVAFIAEIGFESFVETPCGVNAYAQEGIYDQRKLEAALLRMPCGGAGVAYESSLAEERDWNKVWEENYFEPILIGGRCVVHSTFHKDFPAAEHEVIINPQMSFGTGHHATTVLMAEELLGMPVEGRSVVDMGCGTSLLAILSSKLGAARVVAIDFDEWCVTNSKSNIALNGAANIEVIHGDASSLAGCGMFDVVLANINRNTLVNDLPVYAGVMHPGAVACLSGFYADDLPIISRAAGEAGLDFSHSREKEGWALAAFRKPESLSPKI